MSALSTVVKETVSNSLIGVQTEQAPAQSSTGLCCCQSFDFSFTAVPSSR